jgi:hypothetical protein
MLELQFFHSSEVRIPVTGGGGEEEEGVIKSNNDINMYIVQMYSKHPAVYNVKVFCLFLAMLAVNSFLTSVPCK